MSAWCHQTWSAHGCSLLTRDRRLGGGHQPGNRFVSFRSFVRACARGQVVRWECRSNVIHGFSLSPFGSICVPFLAQELFPFPPSPKLLSCLSWHIGVAFKPQCDFHTLEMLGILRAAHEHRRNTFNGAQDRVLFSLCSSPWTHQPLPVRTTETGPRPLQATQDIGQGHGTLDRAMERTSETNARTNTTNARK